MIRFATNSSKYRSIPHVDRNITVASRDTGVVLRRHAILDAQNLQVCISPYCPQHLHHILWFVFVRVSPRKIESATCRKQQETGRMPVSASRSIIFPCIHQITRTQKVQHRIPIQTRRRHTVARHRKGKKRCLCTIARASQSRCTRAFRVRCALRIPAELRQ